MLRSGCRVIAYGRTDVCRQSGLDSPVSSLHLDVQNITTFKSLRSPFPVFLFHPGNLCFDSDCQEQTEYKQSTSIFDCELKAAKLASLSGSYITIN